MYSSLKEATALLERDEWVKPYLGRYRKILALALVLGCCTVLFAAGLMFTSGWLIAGSAEMPYSVLMLGTPLLCVRVFGVGKPILRYCERLASHDWVLRFTSNLRKQLYRSFDAEGVFFRASHRLGDALGLLAEDIEHIQNLYLRCVFPTVIALAAGVGLCVLFGCFSPLACLACFVFVLLELFVVPAVSVSINGKRACRETLCHLCRQHSRNHRLDAFGQKSRFLSAMQKWAGIPQPPKSPGARLRSQTRPGSTSDIRMCHHCPYMLGDTHLWRNTRRTGKLDSGFCAGSLSPR